MKICLDHFCAIFWRLFSAAHNIGMMHEPPPEGSGEAFHPDINGVVLYLSGTTASRRGAVTQLGHIFARFLVRIFHKEADYQQQRREEKEDRTAYDLSKVTTLAIGGNPFPTMIQNTQTILFFLPFL